jgi:hypothetical protein
MLIPHATYQKCKINVFTEAQMSDWESFLRQQLLPGEELISFVEDLYYEFFFVPHVKLNESIPIRIEDIDKKMTLALTSHRIIARYSDGWTWYWLYISCLNCFSEEK